MRMKRVVICRGKRTLSFSRSTAASGAAKPSMQRHGVETAAGRRIAKVADMSGMLDYIRAASATAHRTPRRKSIR
jgi:hypothetical protein